ncbi:MAG: hypothetical protein JO210_10195 [Acidobacteriaceae bacterium]|nr:hypothetical protein [Acidobacteriaceae bacterium]
MINPRLLRLIYACEFLLALLAIFTSWSEIGGQAALDLMHWSWKLGLGLALAAAFVAYTAALLTEESLWSLRSARWLTAMIVLIVAMGAVTYFYALQVDAGDSDETAPTIHRALNRSTFFVEQALPAVFILAPIETT